MSGADAWLGWMLNGLEMHLYTLVAAPFVMQLLTTTDAANPEIKEKSVYIQATFLVGWALGGAFFGRLGDLLGRSRTLADHSLICTLSRILARLGSSQLNLN